MTSSQQPERSRQAAEAALVEATARLLAVRGPERLSLRDIADEAGVNKGLIHHYFGGKRPLVEAAVRKLAEEHFANATARGGGPLPAPLTLGLDEQYWQVIARLILEGDLELAGLEFDEGISVPRRAFDVLATDHDDSTDLKAAVAAAMALELGWAAFKPFVAKAVRAEDDEIEAVEEELRATLRRIVGSALKRSDTPSASDADPLD